MSIPDNYQQLPGYKTTYTEDDVRKAIAICEAMILNNLGSGGGGGGTTPPLAGSANQLTEIARLESIIVGLGNILLSSEANESATINLLLPASNTASSTNNIALGIGNSNDSIATSDSGNFNLLQFVKRALVNYLSLIPGINNKIPNFQTGGQPISNALSVSQIRKQSIIGFTSIAASNSNLLDSTGAGISTDVRDFQSGVLYIVSTATTGNYSVTSSFDINSSIGLKLVQLQEIDTPLTNPVIPGITPTATTRAFLMNLSGLNFIRVNLVSSTAGIQALAVLNQAPYTPYQTNIVQTNAAALNVNASVSSIATVQNISNVNGISNANNPIFDIVSGVITTSITTGSITPSSGLSYEVQVIVTAVSGTNPSFQMDIQESVDFGVNWNTIYSFAPITANGIYRSARIAATGNRIRYVQNISGTTPSFTRSITRVQSNENIASSNVLNRNGSINTSADLAVFGKIRRVTVNNHTGSVIYLQIFNKATALTTGDVPSQGEIYPIPVNNFFTLGVADLGNYGTFFGANCRLGLSSTFNTYTAVSPVTNTSIFVETL